MGNEYLFYKKYGIDNTGGCLSPTLFIILLVVILLSSCKNIEYVPVEVVKTEVVHKIDTVEKKVETNKETNTIIREARPEDSAMLAKLGIKLSANERLLILQQEQINSLMDELKEVHYKDSVRVDSVEVPVPVERKLSKWETICLDYGKVMMGGTIAAVILLVVLIVLWIRKRFKKL